MNFIEIVTKLQAIHRLKRIKNSKNLLMISKRLNFKKYSKLSQVLFSQVLEQDLTEIFFWIFEIDICWMKFFIQPFDKKFS